MKYEKIDSGCPPTRFNGLNKIVMTFSFRSKQYKDESNQRTLHITSALYMYNTRTPYSILNPPQINT